MSEIWGFVYGEVARLRPLAERECGFFRIFDRFEFEMKELKLKFFQKFEFEFVRTTTMFMYKTTRPTLCSPYLHTMSIPSLPSFQSVVSIPMENTDNISHPKEPDRIDQQIEIYKSKIAKERKKLEDLNEKIVQHEMKSLEHQRRAGTDNFNDNRVNKIETEKRICIDRLNKKLVALNTKISSNKELRRKIDEMVRIRLPVLSSFSSYYHIFMHPP